MTTDLRVAAGPRELAVEAAREFARAAREAVAARDSFTVVLSGGETPKALFALLAEDRSLPWDRTHVFFADERPVPPSHPDSNFGSAEAALFSRLPVAPASVHRLRGETVPPALAAAEYEADLRKFFRLAAGAAPRFDLVLLGLGSDGHTASLFPGVPPPAPGTLAAAPWVPRLGSFRLTLTPEALNGASEVVFLVSGEGKAEALRAARDDGAPASLPSKSIRPAHGRLLWLADRAAASRL